LQTEADGRASVEVVRVRDPEQQDMRAAGGPKSLSRKRDLERRDLVKLPTRGGDSEPPTAGGL
jgi:hypothetical protein